MYYNIFLVFLGTLAHYNTGLIKFHRMQKVTIPTKKDTNLIHCGTVAFVFERGRVVIPVPDHDSHLMVDNSANFSVDALNLHHNGVYAHGWLKCRRFSSLIKRTIHPCRYPSLFNTHCSTLYTLYNKCEKFNDFHCCKNKIG
jgi:hypothetical protein